MKLTQATIGYINIFEKVTGANVKDCIEKDGNLLFIVEEGNIQKALKGLGKIESLLKKKILIIGHSEDITKFVLNLLYPEKPDFIKFEHKILTIEVQDSRMKGRIYGRSRERLDWIQEVVKNYFDIEEIRVV
ncbi:MAG: NusA-like transcription termination signal-binding factor [Candidatus Nanoarchaeia archaeon]